jgi:hypothetical protein
MANEVAPPLTFGDEKDLETWLAETLRQFLSLRT